MTRCLSWVLRLCVFLCTALLSSQNATDTVVADSRRSDETDTSFLANRAVAFPGIDWLNRIASEDSRFSWDGVSYTSSYSALMEGDPLNHPCRNFNAWLNSFILPSSLGSRLVRWTDSVHTAHYTMCYVRNFILAGLLYYITAGIFHYFCYVHPMSRKTFEDQGRPRPGSPIMWAQIRLAQASLIIYCVLPVVDEWLVENGLTKVYFTIDQIGGLIPYVFYTVLYFSCVEIGIYWMHRTLHTNKFLYKHIHMLHHKYKTPEMLTPWASIAFHPLDGVLQACPYTLCLPLVPCHYLTHYVMLFFTAVWATYIHDAMDWNVDPVMGSVYHTIHHTHYMYNFGQVFTFCDRFWGTLKLPDGPTGVSKQS